MKKRINRKRLSKGGRRLVSWKSVIGALQIEIDYISGFPKFANVVWDIKFNQDERSTVLKALRYGNKVEIVCGSNIEDGVEQTITLYVTFDSRGRLIAGCPRFIVEQSKSRDLDESK